MNFWLAVLVVWGGLMYYVWDKGVMGDMPVWRFRLQQLIIWLVGAWLAVLTAQYLAREVVRFLD